MKKSLLISLLVLFIAGGLTGIAAASTLIPFSCSGVPLVVTTSSGTLNVVNLGPPVTLTPRFSTGFTYNAIGFRSTDRYLYGVKLGGTPKFGGIIKIDDVGNYINLGNPGLPTTLGYYGGDVSLDGTYMYIHDGDNPTLYIVNLNTFTAASIPIIGGGKNVYDWAYYNGKLYGGNSSSKKLAVLDISTGAQTEYNIFPAMSGTVAFGAAWYDTTNGHVFIYRNGGLILEIDPDTPAFIKQWEGPSITDTDGAFCSAPIVIPEFPTLALPLITIIGLLVTIVAVRRIK